MKKKFVFRIKGLQRGQSFVELMLITLILALLLAGVVEFGFMMNNYLKVQDAAREAARYSSSGVAFTIVEDPITHLMVIADDLPFYYVTALKAALTLTPIKLDADYPDDIVISVFSVDGVHSKRFPNGMDSGWSLCAHYDDFVSYLSSPVPPASAVPIPDAVNTPNYNSGCKPHTSSLSNDDVVAILDQTIHLDPPGLASPPTGVVVVEIFYNYPQLLKLPVFSSIIPDPISLYAYAVMPNSASEPTPVP